MAIHTEYSVRMNSAYPPATRRRPRLPASARNTPVLRMRYPVKRPPTASSAPMVQVNVLMAQFLPSRGCTGASARPRATSAALCLDPFRGHDVRVREQSGHHIGSRTYPRLRDLTTPPR